MDHTFTSTCSSVDLPSNELEFGARDAGGGVGEEIENGDERRSEGREEEQRCCNPIFIFFPFILG